MTSMIFDFMKHSQPDYDDKANARAVYQLFGQNAKGTLSEVEDFVSRLAEAVLPGFMRFSCKTKEALMSPKMGSLYYDSYFTRKVFFVF